MVMAKAPSVAQYQQLMVSSESGGDQIAEKVRTSLHSPQVKVAVRLKNLYDRGYLPFWAAMAKINFKSPKADRFVGYLLDYQPKRDNVAILPEQDPNRRSWDETPYPPVLPPINDKRILRRVLTDKSLRQPTDFLELQTEGGVRDFSNNHNRKLALRGANILDLALVDVLDNAFPNAHEDDVAHLQYKLTRPHVLARLAYCYNLPEAVMHLVSTELPPHEKLVMFQNVFLAYIGGLAASDYTYEEMRNWIRKLYAPFVLRVHADGERDDTLKSPADVATAEFHFLIDRVNGILLPPTERINYEFVFTSEEEPYACTLHVADLQLGVGTGTLFGDAKKRAVQATFDLKELRGQLVDYLAGVYGHRKQAGNSENSYSSPRSNSADTAGPESDPESSLSTEKDDQNTEDRTDDRTDDDDYEPAIEGDHSAHSWSSDAPEGTQSDPASSSSSSSSSGGVQPAHSANITSTTKESSITGPALPRTPAANVRKPLPYGALPAIPKKRFAKK